MCNAVGLLAAICQKAWQEAYSVPAQLSGSEHKQVLKRILENGTALSCVYSGSAAMQMGDEIPRWVSPARHVADHCVKPLQLTLPNRRPAIIPSCGPQETVNATRRFIAVFSSRQEADKALSKPMDGMKIIRLSLLHQEMFERILMNPRNHQYWSRHPVFSPRYSPFVTEFVSKGCIRVLHHLVTEGN